MYEPISGSVLCICFYYFKERSFPSPTGFALTFFQTMTATIRCIILVVELNIPPAERGRAKGSADVTARVNQTSENLINRRTLYHAYPARLPHTTAAARLCAQLLKKEATDPSTNRRPEHHHWLDTPNLAVPAAHTPAAALPTPQTPLLLCYAAWTTPVFTPANQTPASKCWMTITVIIMGIIM